jgi:hypothetical protein
MIGKSLFRSIRHRCHAAIVWAMVPVALLSGRTVSGCIGPTGRFEPDCHCAAMQEAGKNASDTNEAGDGATCHLACCHGKCCCKGNGGCCQTTHGFVTAKSSSQPKDNNLSNGGHCNLSSDGHCRPFSYFAAVTVTSLSGQSLDLQQPVDVLPVVLHAPLTNAFTAPATAVELDTGPPPDNLVVALHRWLI